VSALLHRSASALLDVVHNGDIALRVDAQLHRVQGHHAGPSEVSSWRASLPVLLQDLVDAGLGDVDVLLEYQLPFTSRRVDAVLAGTHPQTGEPSFVAVELKQWSAATTWEDDPALVSVPHSPGLRLHPQLQVDGYRQYLIDFVSLLHDRPASVQGVAYLHNAYASDVDVDPVGVGAQPSVMFTADRKQEWLAFLTTHLSPQSAAGAGHALLESSFRPSRSLLAVAADQIRTREQFTLLAEQQLAYRLVLHEVERADRSRGKTIVVVTGGPG